MTTVEKVALSQICVALSLLLADHPMERSRRMCSDILLGVAEKVTEETEKEDRARKEEAGL